MRLRAVVELVPNLAEPELAAWVERGWVRPDHSGDEWVFHDIDVARIRMIQDLRYAMAVQDEVMPLVLSLLDQVYRLRGQMHAVARAVESQDEAVRNAIIAAIRA